MLVLTAIAILVSGIFATVFAEEREFSVDTDLHSYPLGSEIKIIVQVGSRQNITLQIIAPNGSLIKEWKNITTSTNITAEGPSWSQSGTYTVKAIYGSEQATTTFQFDSNFDMGMKIQTEKII